MKFLNEGDKHYVQGSGKSPYEIKKVGGVVSCSCPAWRNLGGSIDNRVCKHIKKEIDPACLLPQAQTQAAGLSTLSPAATKAGAPSVAVEAPPLLLAHTFEDEDPTNWWMSEKLDGVRAYWDGSKFISRLGNEYHAPLWFSAAMPQGIKLDGELFAGRKRFQFTVSAVRKLVPDDEEWMDITYVVFDALDRDEEFEARIKYLNHLRENDPDMDVERWTVLKQERCRGMDHMISTLRQVESKGGEGLMLRQQFSKYESGRSRTLLKVKTFHDAEAVIIGHEPGKGKHKGRMGAVVCKDAKGITFAVGSGFTDKQREDPPGIGTKITYRYQELTKDGKPRFPTFVTARDYE